MVGRDDLALDVVGSGCGHAEKTGNEAHLEHRDADGAPDLFHHRLNEVVLTTLHHVGGFEEYLTFGGGRCRRPFGEGGLGGIDRAAGVLGVTGRDVGVHVAGVRVVVLEGLATRGIDPLPVDVHLGALGGHVSS